MSWIGVVALSLVAWSACGGDASNDDNTGGSGTGSGAAGAGGNTSCVEGGSCFGEGTTCTDNACCPCAYECSGGTWQIQACAGCAQPECPGDIPEDGAPCDACGPSNCSYQACANGTGVSAVCNGGQWSVDTSTCEEPPPCGEDPTSPVCELGDVCVMAVHTVGPTSEVTYSCEPNPCLPYDTSCTCAQSLCQAAEAPICVEADSQLVQCDNGAQ